MAVGPSAPLVDLPTELLAAIFEQYLRMGGSLVTLLRVCKKLKQRVTRIPALWCHTHLCVDSIPALRRNGSVPLLSTPEGLGIIWERTGPSKTLKVVLVLGDITQPNAHPEPTLLVPPIPQLIAPTPTEPTDKDLIMAERRAELFQCLRSPQKPNQQRPTDRIRSLRININPPMNRRLIEISLGDLFGPINQLPKLPVLERLKISIAEHHTVPEICIAFSFLLHALSSEAFLLRTLCLERVPMGLLTRILSPFPFHGPYPNQMAKRLKRISIKNTFEDLDISAFALAEALEELSFSGTLSYHSDIAPTTTSVTLLPGTNPNLDEIMGVMWRTLYPGLATLPPPAGNLTWVPIPNLRRLCVGTMSMSTLQRLRLPMLKELTIMRMEQYDNSPLPNQHSILLTGLRKLIIGTYWHEIDAIVAPNLEYFEIGIPETPGTIDEESDWCTHGCNIANDGTFNRNCEGRTRPNHINNPPPPLLNSIFDGDEAMLRPRSLRISGPVHDHILVDALHHLPGLDSLTLNYRVAIGDGFWRRMIPRAGSQSTEPNEAASTLCPKLKHLTLDLCTMLPDHSESDHLRRSLRDMIDSRNQYPGTASLEKVSIRWKAPQSEIGSPMENGHGAQVVIENIMV